jgi:chromosome segregation ATPase
MTDAIPSLLGWGTWFGLAADYVVAGLLIAGGLYLALTFASIGLVRFAGLLLIGLGVAVGCIAYGKASGAAECNAAWREKNYEARIARLEQQLDAKTQAAAAAQDSLKVIASEKEKTDATVADYQVAVAQLEGAVAACRRATADDDRRMCQILGPAAAGCRPAR